MLGQLPYLVVVVSLVHTQPLRRTLIRFGPINGHGVELQQVGSHEVHVVQVGHRDLDDQWHAACVVGKAPAHTLFAAIGRVKPGFLPPERSLCLCSVEPEERPVDAVELLVSEQAGIKQMLEKSFFGLLLNAAVGLRGWSDARGVEGVLLATGA
jgi:hypothetical protein